MPTYLASLLATLILAGSSCSALSAAPGRFRMILNTSVSGSDPFGTGSGKTRLYSGETLTAYLNGEFVGVTVTLPSNAELVEALQPCLLPGSDHPEIGSGGPLDCLPGISWIKKADPDTPYDLEASLIPTLTNLPAGDYTLVVRLAHPILMEATGTAAELRSNPIVMETGPPIGDLQILAALLRAALHAEVAGDWTLAEQKARALIALYPGSIHAWSILGDARAASDDLEQARSHYQVALGLLEEGGDYLSPEIYGLVLKDEWLISLQTKIAEIEHPLNARGER